MAPPLASVATSTTVPDQATSRLMRLPAELRKRIYELALPTTAIMPARKLHTSTSTKRPGPSLLLTCKQIHDEAIGLWYWNTSFWFLKTDAFVEWAATIPAKYLQLIHEVILVKRCPSEWTKETILSFDFGSQSTTRYTIAREPDVVLRSAAERAIEVIKDATVRAGVKEGVVKVAMQVSPLRKEKWWTDEPVKFVEEVIAEAGKE